MASPQVEKGYTRIANEVLEHIVKTNFNGTQLKIVLAIWRLTYGFRRKEYELSLAKLSEVIDTTKSHVDRELTALIERNIIKVLGVGPRRGRILSFNKNYDEWDQVKIVEPPKEPEKPKRKAKPKKKYDENNTYYKMALYFFDKVSVVAEEAGVKHLVAKANLQKWADDFRLLVEKDQVDKRLAKNVMDWVTEDDFWKTNVLSAKKLREKFGELAIKMAAKKKPSQPVQKPKVKDVRDKDIEFQRFIAAGGDPHDFDWGK